ncbi:cardiolipin synthase [Brevibacillus composti]|uniref:Cardiolipin synthase n=1 Tax=Brevibacillus composti TaxID=2796470 RepID=A0A7T5EKS6_9BACL|nr:cardiolipin synthase [Brevibacillus composti]QQE74423.1 cardiolipin synthase [Brevibacillus composti]QUO41505.1 cardiolipin synthase [Brevibacillus composti]
MELFQQIYAGLSIINLLLAAVLIFMERRNIASTWAWLMVLLFLPGVGFVLYLLFGQRLSRRKLYKLKEGEFSRYRVALEKQKQEIESNSIRFHDPAMVDHRNMIHMNLVSDAALFTQDNEIDLYTEGHGKFEALFACIDQARDHIHLQYYIIRDDALGQRLIQALTERARQGVKVRLLYDAVGSSELTRRFFRPLVEAGGEVAAFFQSPIPYVNMWVNFRNHRKLVIIDGVIGFIGGFNVGNEYLGLDKRLGYWRDTHLKIVGNAVHLLQARFYLDWNLTGQGKRRMEDEVRYFPRIEGKGKVGVQIVSSGPNSEKQQIKHGYLKMIYNAKERIYLQSPYLIPDESLLTALKMAAMSGVDVRVMIPGRADHKLVYWASQSYLGELLKSGVRCYLYEKGFLHAKTMVVDGQIASVGSANLDIRSFKINFETNAFLFDTGMAKRLERIFREDLAECHEVTREEYENRPLKAKLQESLTRLLSPIL